MYSPGQPVRAVKGDAVGFVRLLHAGGLEIVQNHGGEVGAAGVVGATFLEQAAAGGLQFVVGVDGEDAVGRIDSTVNGPATRTVFLSSYGWS